MSLRLKANLAFALVAIIALGVVYALLHNGETERRFNEAARETRLMLAQADSINRYTQDEIQPLLNASGRNQSVFVPQGAEFYAVERTGQILEQTLPGYSLRRVVLDPGGKSDAPNDWERLAINRLRADKSSTSYTETQYPESVSTVVPLRMREGVCATCYTSLDSAPVGIRDSFGSMGGFNRQLGEIVGITVATVPFPPASSNGKRGIIALTIVIIAFWITLNLLLEFLIFRPLSRISDLAERVSLGERNVEEFDTDAIGEVGSLGRSFNRLRRSMESALELLES